MAQDTYVTPKVVASGTTWAQFKTGGLRIILQNLLAANPALADPVTACTATATGGGASGGLLPAGAYYFAYTWVNGFGETLLGASEVASPVTVGATNVPRVTIPSLPAGASSANIYATAAGGASGSETLYATGVTTTTFDCSFASGSDPAAPPPPASNTTAAANAQELVGIPLNEYQGRFFGRLFGLVDHFLRGDPVPLADLKARHARHAAAMKVYAAAMDEAGVLIAANPGVVGTQVIPGTGLVNPVRTLS